MCIKKILYFFLLVVLVQPKLEAFLPLLIMSMRGAIPVPVRRTVAGVLQAGRISFGNWNIHRAAERMKNNGVQGGSITQQILESESHVIVTSQIQNQNQNQNNISGKYFLWGVTFAVALYSADTYGYLERPKKFLKSTQLKSVECIKKLIQK